MKSIPANEIFQKVDARQLGMMVMFYHKSEADAEITRLEAAVKVAFDYISFMSDSDRDIIKQALRGGRQEMDQDDYEIAKTLNQKQEIINKLQAENDALRLENQSMNEIRTENNALAKLSAILRERLARLVETAESTLAEIGYVKGVGDFPDFGKRDIIILKYEADKLSQAIAAAKKL